MEWIVLQHLTGTAAPRLDVFCARRQALVTFGRDHACDVRFDAMREQQVGRRHAHLNCVLHDDATRSLFRLVDLDALHGTFVNGERVLGQTELAPGDLIQLGSGGPLLRFDIARAPCAGSL